MKLKEAVQLTGKRFSQNPGSKLVRLFKEPRSSLKKILEFCRLPFSSKGGTILKESGEYSLDNPLLCGDTEELHERVSGRFDFARIVEEIQKAPPGDDIKIGISRYNFFKLNEIIKFALTLRRETIKEEDFSGERLNIFPLDRIHERFEKYADNLNALDLPVRVQSVDRQLSEILEIVELNARLYPEREKNLARLLGIICEEAFIGPQTIVIDPFHRCNVKCAHCFVHNPAIKHPEEFLNRKLNLEKFQAIIDDAVLIRSDDVILQGDGEPLLHPDFMKMIAYVRNKGLGALFFTNGSLLDRAAAEQVIDLGVESIYCSLPAGTEEVYEKVASVSEQQNIFGRITRNMKTLMELKREKKGAKPYVIMTHVIHSMNYHELIKMAETDAWIGADAARFYLIRLDNNNQHLRLTPKQLEVLKKDLPQAEEIFKKAGIDFISNIKFQFDHYDEATGAWSKDIFLKQGCPVGWFFCLIPALGDISMCCHLRTTGDLQKNSFKEIWFSDYYQKKRRQAKYISQNKNVGFLNGVSLYDEHCEHCDNHQNLLMAFQGLKDTGLDKFFNDPPKRRSEVFKNPKVIKRTVKQRMALLFILLYHGLFMFFLDLAKKLRRSIIFSEAQQ